MFPPCQVVAGERLVVCKDTVPAVGTYRCTFLEVGKWMIKARESSLDVFILFFVWIGSLATLVRLSVRWSI